MLSLTDRLTTRGFKLRFPFPDVTNLWREIIVKFRFPVILNKVKDLNSLKIRDASSCRVAGKQPIYRACLDFGRSWCGKISQ
jgi:hypothetical protein